MHVMSYWLGKSWFVSKIEKWDNDEVFHKRWNSFYFEKESLSSFCTCLTWRISCLKRHVFCQLVIQSIICIQDVKTWWWFTWCEICFFWWSKSLCHQVVFLYYVVFWQDVKRTYVWATLDQWSRKRCLATFCKLININSEGKSFLIGGQAHSERKVLTTFKFWYKASVWRLKEEGAGILIYCTKQYKLWNGNYKLKTRTLTKKPRKNIKNSAKNEKSVFFRRQFWTCFKNGSDYEIYYEIFVKIIASKWK